MQRLHTTGIKPQSLTLTLLDQNDVPSDVATDALAPYEILHFLYEDGQFSESLLSDKMPLHTYWETLMKHDWTIDHPMRGRPDLWGTTIPLVYFTDGAEFSKSSAAEGFVAFAHLV